MKRVSTILTATIAAVVLLAAAPAGDVEEVVKGNNAFAFDLYKQLAQTPGNLVFSPYSISTALAMTYAGARGETEKEMAPVMHFTLPQKRLHPAMGQLISDLNKMGKKGHYELIVANRLYGEQSKNFLQSYRKVVDKYYQAGFDLVNFHGDPEGVRHAINQWSAEKTHGKIPEPIPAGGLSNEEILALVNAVYFKGKWMNQFERHDTKNRPFYLSSAKTVDVPMMGQREKFNFLAATGVKILEKKYVGEDISMWFILPDDVDGLDELEDSLTHHNFYQWLYAMENLEVDVLIPRFKLEWDGNMSPIFLAMGMATAFNREANFEAMNGARDIYISQILHSAMISVDEEGTEAAAFSMGGGTLGSAAEPMEFHADHPFIFIIRDNQTGSILFMGRVMDPRG